jgi:putative membrane protein
MKKCAAVLVGLVAALHLFFLVLEMFLWQTPFGLRTFNMTPEVAANSAVLAMNQGLYNGFLAAGLIWTFFIEQHDFQRAVRFFFLGCIIIAGIFGGMTAKFSIIYTQALPALLAFIAVKYSHEK